MGLRISVADDERSSIAIFERLLPKCGHTVVSTSADGLELLHAVSVHEPDLVITDIRMPRMDGLIALEQIKRRFGTPVIILSGYHDTKYVEAACVHNVMAYLTKPASIGALSATIPVAMKQHKDYASLRTQLEERKILERAKGILMMKYGVNEGEAWKLLLKEATAQHLKPAAFAESIIHTHRLESGLQATG